MVNDAGGAKKIIHVNQYGCYKGGVENYIREIAENMHEYEHHLLYAFDGDDDYLRIFAGAYDFLQKENKRIEEAVLKINPDHLIVYNIGNKSMKPFFALRDRMGFKIIKSIHDYGMIYTGTGYNRLTLQRMHDPVGWHSISGCIKRDAYTRKIKFENIWHKKELLAEVNEADAIEIHTEDMKRTLIRNGIRADKMYWNPPWAKKIEGPTTEPQRDTILFVGNLIRGKGLYLLLKALKRVNRHYSLMVAGDGYQKKELERYAAAQKVNASFLGLVTKERLTELYRSSLFMVLPSILEPFGFVIVEAMSHKRPVIAFNTGGVSETIQDSITGYLIKPFDLNEMARKIEYLLENPGMAFEMGQKAYGFFLSKFTFEQHLQRLCEKLLELES